MNVALHQILPDLQAPVVIERESLSDETISGFVVCVTDDLLLVHVIDDSLFLDGYSVIRTDDISDLYRLPDHESAARRAIHARGQMPVLPDDLVLVSLSTMIRSLQSIAPLVAIHCEVVENEICHVGKIVTVQDRQLTLLEIDPAGEWEGKETYDLAGVTRVDFGGAYERALWLVNCIESGDPALIAEARRLDGQG